MMPNAPYGSEFYDQEDARVAYLRHRHDGRRSPNTVMEEPALFEVIGSLQARRVLDLGCGDGATAELAIAAGAASYVGIDGSAGMIDAALQRQIAGDVRFEHDHMEIAEFGVGAFDVAISRMALHYIDDLTPVFASVWRSLVPGGRFVFSVVHPVISSNDDSGGGQRRSWTVDNYFNRGPQTRSWFNSTVTWQHRTVEDYARLLIAGGFSIDALSECEPQAELLGVDTAELKRRRRVPLMLVIGGTRA